MVQLVLDRMNILIRSDRTRTVQIRVWSVTDTCDCLKENGKLWIMSDNFALYRAINQHPLQAVVR